MVAFQQEKNYPWHLVDEENIKDLSQTETLTDEDTDEMNLLLYTRERLNVSN